MTTMKKGKMTAEVVYYDEIGEMVNINRLDSVLTLPVSELDDLLDLLYDISVTKRVNN